MSTNGATITENFSFNCEVMASLVADVDNYGTKGVLFPSLYDQNQWLSRGFVGGSWNYSAVVSIRTAGSFSSFAPIYQNGNGVTYEAVGNTANASIGYPASDVVSEEQYWIDWMGNEVGYDTGNGPYTRVVHSEPPTSIDLSGSDANSVAFSPLGNFSDHNAAYGFNEYGQYYSQYGDMPAAGSSTIHLSVSGVDSGGSPVSLDNTSTFSFPSTAFQPDTAFNRENYSSYKSIVETVAYEELKPHPQPTIVSQFSGSFTYEPAYYFNNA